jgi:hypothetical protein
MTRAISPSSRRDSEPIPHLHVHALPNDWCHLCGVRSDHTLDVWYPRNAEHVRPGMETVYVRICSRCLGKMLGAFKSHMDTTAWWL